MKRQARKTSTEAYSEINSGLDNYAQNLNNTEKKGNEKAKAKSNIQK